MKETKSTPAADIRELVTAVKAQMSELGYSQYTIDRMDAVWKNLASYCEEHNDGLLTAESARCFVWDIYGAVLGEKDTSQNVNRAVHILLDFQQFGMIFKQSHMTLKSFSDAFSPLFEGFLEKLRKDGFAEGSVRTWRSRLFRFEYFLANSGIDRFSQIELHHLNAYIETLAGFSSGTVGDSWRDNQAPWKAVRLCPRKRLAQQELFRLPAGCAPHTQLQAADSVYPGGSGADTGIR